MALYEGQLELLAAAREARSAAAAEDPKKAVSYRIPARLVVALKAVAKRNNRNPNQQLTHILELAMQMEGEKYHGCE